LTDGKIFIAEQISFAGSAALQGFDHAVGDIPNVD
jgi:hypothetical protein